MNAEVSLELASSIKSEDDELYYGSSGSFTTALVNLPASVAITSTPTDAFGMSHLNGTTPLELTITLEGVAGTDDYLTLYIYGSSDTAGSFSLLTREVIIDEGAVEVILGESQLDLADGSNGARFVDGDVYIAVSVRRGSARSPVRLLDTDPLESGSQPAVLDTVPPVFIGLGTDGTQTSEYVSTGSALSVLGLADEELAAVEVEVTIDSMTHTNGAFAPVVGANSISGGFVAAPIELGIVDPATLPGDMTVTIYDRALNPAVPLNVTWRQVGASGPGRALPGGGDVTVRVFDAVTHQMVSDALVLSHEGDTAATYLDHGPTDSLGVALVSSAASGETVVTVDAVGYDLFTFHGVPTTRLDVPLQPSLPDSGEILYGMISSGSPGLLFGFNKYIADDRMTTGPVLAGTASDCPGDLGCSFEVDVLTRRFGVATALVTFEQTEFDLFSWFEGSGPDGFLKVVQPDFLTAAAPAPALTTLFTVDKFLDDASVDAEERAIEGPSFIQFDTSGLLVLDNGNLEGGRPQVFVEAAVPGTAQRMTVGAGHAFFDTITDWVVVSAYAGAADGIEDGGGDLLGRWVSEGMIEEDLFLRVDAVDMAGNSSGRRVRFSAMPSSLVPSDVPELVSPTIDTGGSASFELEFMDTLNDDQDGLFKVHMTDNTGRSWDVWHLNEPGFGHNITANVPEISPYGGQPLADGQLEVTVSLRGVPEGDFNAAEGFFWRTLFEQADSRAETAPITLQQ